MNIGRLEEMLAEDGIVFLTYSGFLTQSLIVGMTEALEKESENSEMGGKVSNNIYTIFIELSQNMMNYSKSKRAEDNNHDPKGLILIGKMRESGDYYVLSQNIIDYRDKEKIEPKLIEISGLDQDALKVRYRELRKSGKDKHHQGAGIGFYEIAKRCNAIEYQFKALNQTKYQFMFKAILHAK